jgi:hypothetical protein
MAILDFFQEIFLEFLEVILQILSIMIFVLGLETPAIHRLQFLSFTFYLILFVKNAT